MSSDQDKRSGSEEPTIPPGEPHSDKPTAPPTNEQKPKEAAAVSSTKADTSFPEGERTSRPGTKVRYFGDYELLEEIARGGMGVVYRARQVSLNRIVALKMILAGQLASEDEVQRFHTEAEAAAKLDHPGIVPIYEVGEHEGHHYFSMGFVAGQSLAGKLADGPLPPTEAAELTRQVAEAVAYAHQQGVIHRDLKPANVLLARHRESSVESTEQRKPGDLSNSTSSRLSALDSRPRITDFGLAKKLEADSNLTGTGQILGTPSFMPPEQAAGKTDEIGPAADVYALGAVLFTVLTGRPPFQAASPLETLLQVLETEPVPPRQLNAVVPRDLDTICLKCLEKQASKRYASAQDLAEELQRYLRGEPIVARPISSPARVWRWCRRKPLMAGLLFSVAASLVVGAAVSSHFALLANRRADAALRQKLRADANATEANSEKIRADNQAAEALAEKQRADEKAVEALREKESAERQLQRSEQLLYANQIGSAQREYEANNTALALDHLDACRWDLRGWEHDYLSTLNSRRQQTLWRDRITEIAFSPDGKRIVGGNHDQITIWDVKTGQEVLTLRGHTGTVNSVAFSPDGRQVVSGSQDKTVRLWNAVTGTEMQALEGYNSSLESVAFSPDGRQIATASGDKTLKLSDAKMGRQIRIGAGHADRITSLAFSPEDQRIVTGSADKTLKVWDVATFDQILTLNGHTEPVTCVAYSPDGQKIVSGAASADRSTYGGSVRLWDAVTGQQLRVLDKHGKVYSVAFTPDGRQVVSGGADNTVKLWDVTSGQELRSLPIRSEAPVTSVAVHPDGTRIASAASSALTVWNVAPGLESLDLGGHTDGVASVAFHPDGRQVVSGSLDMTLRLWDAVTGRELSALRGHADRVTSVAFSSDGQWIVSGSWDKTIRLWDAFTGQELLALKGHLNRVNAVALSPDGSEIISGSGKWLKNDPGELAELKLWDVAAGKEIRDLQGHESRVTSVAFSPDGSTIASGSRDRSIKLWNASTGQEMHTLQGHTQDVTQLDFSRDGKRLLSVGGNCKLWNTITGEELRGPQDDDIVCAAFNHDGRRFVSGGRDKALKVWDAASGQLILTLKGHAESINTVAFSRDGRRIVSGGTNAGMPGELKVWDATRPREILVGQKTAGVIRSVGISHDGATLVTGGGSDLKGPGEVRLWDTLTGREISTFHETATVVRSVAFHPDGSRIISGGGYGGLPELKVWDAASGQNLATLEGHARLVTCVAFSPNGSQIISGADYAGPRKRGEVRVWDAHTGDAIFSLQHQERDDVTCAAFSPDGKRIVSGSAGSTLEPAGVLFRGELKLWDAETGDEILTFQGQTGAVEDVDFSPNGRWIVSAGHYQTRAGRSGRGEATLWDAMTGEKIVRIDGLNQIQRVAFSPDSKRFATATSRSLRLWKAPEGREILTIKSEHFSHLDDVIFSPDGKQLIRTRPDAIGVWNLALLLRERIRDATELGQWQQVRDAYRMLADLEQTPGKYAFELSATFAVESDWSQAARALEEPRGSEKDVQQEIYRALSLLAADDSEAYRRVCGELLADDKALKSAGSRIARLCALSPHATDDHNRLVQLAKAQLASRPHSARVTAAYGAALYRAGQFEESVAHFNAAGELIPRESLFLAMAWHKSGQTEAARQRLAATLGNISYYSRGANPETAFDVAELNLLAGQAESLIFFPTWSTSANVQLEFGDSVSQVFIDGDELDTELLRKPFQLPPGEHKLLAKRGGKEIASRTFIIHPWRRQVVSVLVADRRAAERALEIGASLELMIAGVSRRLVKGEDELPAEEFRIVGMRLANTSAANDDFLSVLSGLQRLRALSLQRTPITDLGLENLKGMTELRTLDLRGCQNVTDFGLEHLRDLQQLDTLLLSDTKVGDVGLQHLKDMQLDSLSLRRTSVTSAGVPFLAHLKKLRTLDLGELPITDESLRGLETLTALETFQLDGTQLTGLGLKFLQTPLLRELNLCNSQANDEGLNSLHQFGGLVMLDLGNTRITDEALKHCQPLSNLEHLRLNQTAASAWGITNFRKSAKHVKIIDFEPLTFTGHTVPVNTVAVSADGRRIASGGGAPDGPAELKVWDAATGKELASFTGHTDSVACVAFSHDGQGVISAGGPRHKNVPGEVKIWEVASGREMLSLSGFKGEVAGVAFSSDGNRVVTAGGLWNRRGELIVWDATTGKRILELAGDYDFSGVAFSPDDQRVVASGGRHEIVTSAELRMWETTNGRELFHRKHKDINRLSGVAFSPDGEQVIATSWNGSIGIWNAASGTRARLTRGHTDVGKTVVYSPDGKWIASGGDRYGGPGELKIWDATSGEEILNLDGHLDLVSSVTFSPDSKKVISGSRDKTIKVWNVF